MPDESLPLSRHPLVRTRDPEEAIALYARFTTPVLLDLPAKRRRAPFSWYANCLALGGITVSAHALGCEVKTSTVAVGDVYSLSLPTGAGRGEGWHGKESVELRGHERGIIISPGQPARGRLGAGYEGIQLNVGLKDLDGAFSTLTGQPLRTPLIFGSDYRPGRPHGSAFLRMLSFSMAEADRADSALASPLVAARHAEALLFQLLLDQPHNHSAGLRGEARAAEPKHVRTAAEYLDANLGQPVRMLELSSLTGVSVRSLQVGFQKHRGASPLEFLRMRRLNKARELLLGGDGTVTQIALTCGFEHLGRFSLQYRARYGESPSVTLTATRARRGQAR